MNRDTRNDRAAATRAQTEQADVRLRTLMAPVAFDGMASTAVACGFLEWAARFLGVGLAGADDDQTRVMLEQLFVDFAAKTAAAQEARRDALQQTDGAMAPVASHRIH
ncbi:MAG: hypothetical protein OXE84_07745 [Rhodobacteraceae bacterium]|nr:hypothetical protein [Paracoccaceae bacterium]MCY4340715.1 hypothetical protein [Gammaproteobacteria bacterium]